jgi:hypothetical protein
LGGYRDEERSGLTCVELYCPSSGVLTFLKKRRADQMVEIKTILFFQTLITLILGLALLSSLIPINIVSGTLITGRITADSIRVGSETPEGQALTDKLNELFVRVGWVMFCLSLVEFVLLVISTLGEFSFSE